MASAFLSRLPGEPSIYETLREQDASDQSDLEERAGMALDEENLGAAFHDYELDDAIAEAAASPPSASRTGSVHRPANRRLAEISQSRGRPRAPRSNAVPEELDDDVPSSLLFEGSQEPDPGVRRYQRAGIPPPVQGPPSRESRTKWQATQEQQRLHEDTREWQLRGRQSLRRNPLTATIDPKEQAMWRWANVQNLDNFLKDVYDYFVGNGIWCILLSRGLNLLTLTFVVGFSVFLSSCIQYSRIPSSKTMSEILVPQCPKKMTPLTNLVVWSVAFLWVCKAFQYVLDIRRLRNMHNFYRHLLEIPDSEIQTVSWQEVVKRIMSLRDSNPATAAGMSERHRRFIGSQSKQRMDAHDIANRLMRRDNYLIALINKDVLDLTLPLPFLKNRQLFSRTMEWNLSLCILDFVFNERGQVHSHFLKDTHRHLLSKSLRRRFMFAGVMNVLCAPFIFVYFLLLFFFRYFNEYQRNPSQIGSRQYTPFAEWKFREFNELWHLFQRRINMSYPFASRYVNQFPKDKTVQVSKFVALVAGALASVLALASVVDPELFLGFEITPDRTVLFYLGVFGTVWAMARGGVPEENLVFDPEFTLKSVTEYTHYLPSHWRGRLHSNEVRTEFALLYQMKLVIFLEEMLSIIFTPFVLWFSLPKCSDSIIDFFREFTVHVDGLGYVCSFAVFDFKKGANNITLRADGQAQDLREDYYSTKDGKMLASYYGFIDHYVTNQGTGAPFPHSMGKHSFHPPPNFPGLMSPNLAADVGPRFSHAERHERQRRIASHARYPGAGTAHQSTYRTSRFAPLGGHSSPMASILLDPQHQPSQSTFRTGHQFGTQSRLRNSTKALANPVEHEEQLPEGFGPPGAGDSEDRAADDSNLGDSWKTTRAGNTEDDGEESGQASNTDRGPGVLGLVYQFSKAQTDGRGTGVNI